MMYFQNISKIRRQISRKKRACLSWMICVEFLGQELLNPLASPSAGAPALKYGYVNTETSSPGEAKG